MEFQKDMRLETLIRCLLRSFQEFGGVPWVGVFDNMKTVITGRDPEGKPIWNQAFLKFAVDIDLHPEVCWLYSANQKGSVENLVGWVKSNFLAGREFLNDEDLAEQCLAWRKRVNTSISQAQGKIPADLLEEERQKFTPMLFTAESYGIFRQVVVGQRAW